MHRLYTPEAQKETSAALNKLWLVARVEKIVGLPVGEPSAAAKCATGDYFVSLTAGGIKPEGEEFPQWFERPSEAEAAYLDSVRDYAAGKAGKLYWREAPSLVHEDGKWQVYSRLVIA
jgi:hypothetical protein